MKKKIYLLVAALPMLVSSCVISSFHQTTGNPIGTKEGVVKSQILIGYNAGYEAAVKKAGITKVGSIDVTRYLFRYKVKVTGE